MVRRFWTKGPTAHSENLSTALAKIMVETRKNGYARNANWFGLARGLLIEASVEETRREKDAETLRIRGGGDTGRATKIRYDFRKTQRNMENRYHVLFVLPNATDVCVSIDSTSIRKPFEANVKTANVVPFSLKIFYVLEHENRCHSRFRYFFPEFNSLYCVNVFNVFTMLILDIYEQLTYELFRYNPNFDIFENNPEKRF